MYKSFTIKCILHVYVHAIISIEDFIVSSTRANHACTDCRALVRIKYKNSHVSHIFHANQRSLWLFGPPVYFGVIFLYVSRNYCFFFLIIFRYNTTFLIPRRYKRLYNYKKKNSVRVSMKRKFVHTVKSIVIWSLSPLRSSFLVLVKRLPLCVYRWVGVCVCMCRGVIGGFLFRTQKENPHWH